MKKQFLLGLMAMLLPLTTWAADNLTVKVNGKTEDIVFVYNGTQTLANLSVTVFSGEDELTASNPTQYFYQITDSEGKPVNETSKVGVGQYTLTAYGQTLDYNGLEGSITFTVKAKEITSLTLADVTKEYGTEDEEIDLLEFVTVPNGLAPGDADEELADFVAGLKLQRKEGAGLETVGSVILVGVTAKEDAESNYVYAPTRDNNVPLTITAKELTVTQIKDRIYEIGKQFNVTNPNAITYFELKGVVNSDDVKIAKLEYNGDGNLTDAGNYPLTVTLGGEKAGNYTVKVDENSVEAYLKIKKATLTVTNANSQDLSKVYGTADPESLYDQFVFTPSSPANATALTAEQLEGIVTIERGEGEDVKYSEEEGKENEVVGYDLTITLTDGDNSNYELVVNEEVNTEFKITPKAIGTEAHAAAEDIEFDAEEVNIVYKGASYQGYTSENIGISLIYTIGEEKKTLEYGKDFKIWIQGDGVDAGTSLTLSITGMGNYSDAIWHSGLEISKADLTIEGPEDESVLRKVGTGTPGDLSEHFTFTGLVGKDNDGNDKPKDAWLTMIAGNRNSSVGTYTVYVYENGSKITGNELNNYNLEYVPVEYKILSADFVLTGGEYTTGEEGEAIENIVTNTEKINQYAGLEVDVTINNLTSLADAGYKADRWYTLVLPFDVTVREISQAFGYAIVNVPQEANDNAEDMVYGLTMGTIPAHTVMAFKIDASVDEKEAETRVHPTLTFEKKTIVAIPEKWFEDAQGNQAIGTYEPLTDIKGENQFWLIPGGAGSGSFQRASVQSYTIQPFNGYFQFAETPANARIILEEADGTTTAINAITGEVINNNAEGWYSIDGMKLNAQPTQKGVYINNGKKVVIK